jgi:hypothetical protein
MNIFKYFIFINLVNLSHLLPPINEEFEFQLKSDSSNQYKPVTNKQNNKPIKDNSKINSKKSTSKPGESKSVNHKIFKYY